MSKDNSEMRFMAYAKPIDGEWFARIYDNELEMICYSDLPKFETGKQAALDLACQMAAHLEEQADKDADYADELETALATDRGVT